MIKNLLELEDKINSKIECSTFICKGDDIPDEILDKIGFKGDKSKLVVTIHD